MVKHILSDRRVWLLGLVLGLVVLVARWTLSADAGFRLVVYTGYWGMLVLVALFLRALWPLACAKARAVEWGRFEIGVIAGVALIMSMWAAHERPGFKILADELLLLGTSMGMHYEREAAYPTRATDIQGAFQILSSVLDKRPLLFPFLTATVHDLTGYRPQNPFYLNMGLAMVFLVVTYLAGWKMTGQRWAGVTGLLLFGGLPLLAQQGTGGGFELLNLVLIATLSLLVVGYLEQPEQTGRLEALIFGALLLASTRYESILFLLFAALAAVIGWMRAGKVVLTWPLIFAPLFLLPLLIQNRIFSGNSRAWEMESLAGVTEPFGSQYFAPNLGHALAFFFDFSGYQPSSALFAGLGLLAMPFLAFWGVQVFRRGRAAPASDVGWALTSASLFAVTAVYLFYFWGQFDQPLIRRLSLPLHWLMLIAILLTVARMRCSCRAWQGLALLAIGGLLAQGLPVLAKQAYRTSYSPGVEMQIREEFLATQVDRNILFLDNDAFFWITHRVPASPIKQAQLRKEGLVYHLRNHSFEDMYVFQSVNVDDQTGKRSVAAADELGDDFVLEPVWERRVQTLLFARISRVTAIRQGTKLLAEAKPFIEPLRERRTVEQLNKNRAIYLENWIKKLP